MVHRTSSHHKLAVVRWRLKQLLVAVPCLYLLPDPANAQHPSEREVTFYADVAPILYARCAGCHHVGGPAPFSLLTYEQAKARSSQIAEVTASRFMPPWLPEAGHVALAGDRRLTDPEIETLARWSEAGSPAGDAAIGAAPPSFADGWQLGAPDVVVESPTFELPPDGPNRFRNFVVRVPDGEDRWVQAVELRPENPKATHHVRLGLDSNHESARRDAADPDVGYEGMAWGEDPSGQLITWTPGMTVDAGMPGAAWQLVPGENLVLHAHLQPTGKRETIGFRIGFHFADGPPTKRPMILRVGSRDIDIPAGTARHEVRDSYELPIDIDLHSIFPHAHSLCREVEVKAVLPDGSAKTLLAIPKFDENWHDTYRFAEPLRLPRGTRIDSRYVYDNTETNPRNPHHPPRRVVYGSNADDEMSDVYLQVTAVNPRQRAVLEEDFARHELASKIVGSRKALELHPEDPWNVESLASCYVAAGSPKLALQLLGAWPSLLNSSTQALLIKGMAELAMNDLEAARQSLRRALDKDDQFALAWLGLGQVLVAQSKPGEAERALSRSVALAPRLTVARLDLIDLLVAQGRIAEAVRACEAAIEVDSDDFKAHLKLANVLALQQRYDASLQHFAAARELAPFVYSPEASLAIACYQGGDESKARQLLREAVAKDPDDPVAYCFLGQIARREQRWKEARTYLERSLNLPLPDTWPARNRQQFLRLVYREQLELADASEDRSLARRAATELLRLDPQDATFKQILKALDATK